MLGSRISTKSRVPEFVNIQVDFRQTKTPQAFDRGENVGDPEGVEHLSNETLAGVLETISDGFMAIDGQWRLTFINKAGREIVRDRISVGANFWDCYPELAGTPVEEAYRKVVRERVAVEFEHYNQAWGRWFEVRAFPAKEEGISIFFRDITERVQVREKMQKDLQERIRMGDQVRDLKLALETQVADLRNLQDLNQMNEERFRMAACGDAITLYEQDADLRYTWLFPLQPQHAGSLGRTDTEIFNGPEGKLLQEWKREVMRTGIPQRREITTLLKSGVRSYDMSIAPRRDHRRNIIGVAGAALDITARMNAERAMRQLAAIVECSEDAIISEDLEGTITSWNKAAERIFGYSAEEMIGQSVAKLIPGNSQGEQAELMVKVVKGERVDSFETVRRHKDGRSIEVSVSVSPLRNEAQKIVGASKIIRDISEHKRRETQERAIYELAMQVNRADDITEILDAAVASIMRSQSADRAAILLCDTDGVMRFKSSCGLSVEYQRAVEGHSPWKCDDPKPQPICMNDVSSCALDDHLRKVINKEGIAALAFIPITYESRLLGKFMVYYNTAHAFAAAELRPAQTIATQVAFAIQRQKAEETLENLVEERTTSLREAVQQMEEFSYTISHDLRAPLRAMQVYSQSLLEDFADGLPPEAIRYVKRLSENATRLDKMILDVLSFSRIARGNHTMEPVTLDKLVREIVQHYPEMQPPRAELTIEALSDVIGHEPSLTQVVSNLLSNAVKFIPADVMPKVKVWTEMHGRFVRFLVRDNGIGIPAQYRHKLFNMFERIHPELPYEGTGVGLAIVRKAVERMNGTFGVESEPGTGSTFWIQLPAAEQTA